MNIFKKTSPIVLWTIGVLVVLVIGGCWSWGGWSGMMSTWRQRQYLNQIENLKEAYRQDTYGASTPEGTLKLFIEAFQKGDVDLASKYFVVEKQGEYRDKIGNWIKLGKKDEITGVLSKTIKGGNEALGSVGMYYQSDKTQPPFVVELVLNDYSKLWKIKDF